VSDWLWLQVHTSPTKNDLNWPGRAYARWKQGPSVSPKSLSIQEETKTIIYMRILLVWSDASSPPVIYHIVPIEIFRSDCLFGWCSYSYWASTKLETIPESIRAHILKILLYTGFSKIQSDDWKLANQVETSQQLSGYTTQLLNYPACFLWVFLVVER
jgi:hypothetical protein